MPAERRDSLGPAASTPSSVLQNVRSESGRASTPLEGEGSELGQGKKPALKECTRCAYERGPRGPPEMAERNGLCGYHIKVTEVEAKPAQKKHLDAAREIYHQSLKNDTRTPQQRQEADLALTKLKQKNAKTAATKAANKAKAKKAASEHAARPPQ